MKRAMRLISIVIGATLAASSLACGVCIEDKVAATYDYGIVMTAIGKHHLVVFGQIEGAVDMRAAATKIAAAAARVRGVDRSTIRTSVSPAAFSFALDPAAQAPAAAVADLQKRVRMQGVKLSVLRVVSSESVQPPPKRRAAS